MRYKGTTVEVIIIIGPLASLKSTVAHRLAIDINAIHLSKDYLKEAMATTIQTTNRKENLNTSKAAVHVLYSIVKNNHHVSTPWIIEANLKHDELALLETTLQNQNVTYKTVYLYADYETLYTRYIAREPNRHHIHKATKPMSYETFKKSVDYYHNQFFDKATITFDTTTFDDYAYEKLWSLLQTHH